MPLGMARTMSSEEYQELGRRYYKQKQYDKAVEAFTNGIEAATRPTITIFDYRAASYDKLKDFPSAIQDGREMIRLNKKDIKGYLRAGSILEKMNKLDKAIGIYKYGMKNVPIDDKNFKLLQQLHDKLTRRLSPPKAIDPFTILPVELVEMVISYLTFRNMVNCLRVSKSWKNYLIRRPNLWTDLDLTGARKDVSRIFVRDAVNRSEYRIRRATIHRFRHYDVLRNLATACKNLTHLEFLSGSPMHDTLVEVAQCASNLKKLVHHIDITLDAVTQIMRHRPTLEHVEFSSIASAEVTATWRGPFPNLNTLILKGPWKTSSHSLNASSLLSQTPALRNLSLWHWESDNTTIDFHSLPLEHLELKNVDFMFFPHLPSSLTQLSLSPRVQFSLPIAPDDTSTISTAASWDNALNSLLPNITDIRLANFCELTPAFFGVLLESEPDKHGNAQAINKLELSTMSALQHLSLRSCSAHENVAGLFNVGGLVDSPRILSQSLQVLDIGNQPCTDDDIEMLLTRTNSLRTVDLSSTNITGAAVKMLVDALPDLKTLNLDNCSRISNRDAIAYAERKGIRTSWKMSDMFGGGRKVRYG